MIMVWESIQILEDTMFSHCPNSCLKFITRGYITMRIWVINCFIFLILATIISGCNESTSSYFGKRKTPTASLPYLLYSPSKNSFIQLEFEFPKEWFLVDEKELQDSGIYILSLVDTRINSTQSLTESGQIISKGNRISILARSIKNQETLETRIESYKSGHNDQRWAKLLDEYKIELGDVNARVIEYQIEPFDDNGLVSTIFERNIFFKFDNRIYQIIFQVGLDDRNGEFEQGYDYLLSSLKTVEW